MKQLGTFEDTMRVFSAKDGSSTSAKGRPTVKPAKQTTMHLVATQDWYVSMLCLCLFQSVIDEVFFSVTLIPNFSRRICFVGCEYAMGVAW